MNLCAPTSEIFQRKNKYNYSKLRTRILYGEFKKKKKI